MTDSRRFLRLLSASSPCYPTSSQFPPRGYLLRYNFTRTEQFPSLFSLAPSYRATRRKHSRCESRRPTRWVGFNVTPGSRGVFSAACTACYFIPFCNLVHSRVSTRVLRRWIIDLTASSPFIRFLLDPFTFLDEDRPKERAQFRFHTLLFTS